MNVLDKMVKADFMRFTLSIPTINVVRWEMEDGECFAYKGISRLGFIEQYDCDVFPRIETWLETLGIAYSVNPRIEKCIMHTLGRCAGDFVFQFDR